MGLSFGFQNWGFESSWISIFAVSSGDYITMTTVVGPICFLNIMLGRSCALLIMQISAFYELLHVFTIELCWPMCKSALCVLYYHGNGHCNLHCCTLSLHWLIQLTNEGTACMKLWALIVLGVTYVWAHISAILLKTVERQCEYRFWHLIFFLRLL